MQINLRADSAGRPWAAAGVVWPGGTFVPASVFSGAPLCAEVTAAAAARALRGLRSADAAQCAQPSAQSGGLKSGGLISSRRFKCSSFIPQHWTTF